VKDFYVKDAPTRENQQITFFLVASKHLHEVGPGAGIYNRCPDHSSQEASVPTQLG
jgi:hypothetical protein